jgi:hypothetical protein
VPQLREALNFYLTHPGADEAERAAFIARECTFTDASAGQRTGAYLLSRLGQRAGGRA